MFGVADRCRRMRRLLSDRIDSPLPARDEKRVVAHLKTCRTCREEEAFYREMKAAARHLEPLPPPGYLWERVSLRLDEHPWGEDPRPAWDGKTSPAGFLIRHINIAGAVVSALLIAALCLLPNKTAEVGTQMFSPTARIDSDRNIEYLSLYMMANGDRFPVEVRDYYLNCAKGLNQKIKTIKSALERYPQNRDIKAQLALAYRQKLELYNLVGMPPAQQRGSAVGDDAERDFGKYGRYE